MVSGRRNIHDYTDKLIGKVDQVEYEPGPKIGNLIICRPKCKK